MNTDFDLNTFVNLFDAALTSNDERVKNTLRQLMMMVILTNDGMPNKKTGPLFHLVNDLDKMTRRITQLEYDLKRLSQSQPASSSGYPPYPLYPPKVGGSSTDYYLSALDTSMATTHATVKLHAAALRDLNINIDDSQEK